eukprot:1052211-Rhodomonas_salina.2
MARLLQQRWHAQAKDEEQEEEELVSFRQSVGAEQSVRGAWSRTMSWSGHGGEVEGLGREELQWKLEELIEHLWALQVLGHSGGWWDGALGQQEEEAKSYVGFLFRGYRISHYWWEVMVRPPALPPPSLAPACHCFGAANRLPAVPATASRSRDPKPYPSANPNLLLGPEPGNPAEVRLHNPDDVPALPRRAALRHTAPSCCAHPASVYLMHTDNGLAGPSGGGPAPLLMGAALHAHAPTAGTEL